MSARILIGAALASAAFASAASAQYRTIATLGDLDGPADDATNLSGAVFDGTTLYAIVNGASSPRINKIGGAGTGGATFGTVMTTAQYQAAAGADTFLSSANFLGNSGADLIFGEIPLDTIFKVNKAGGTTTAFVSAAALESETGNTSARVAAQTTNAAGDLVFYDSGSDAIYRTAGANDLVTLVTEAAIIAAVGDDTINGLTITPGGTIYAGDNDTDAVYAFSGGAGAAALTTAQITGVTGEATAGFSAFTTLSDGRVYFYESVSDDILSFDPSNPSGTLTQALTAEQLIAGPAGTSSINGLLEYEGQLAFFTDASVGVKGVYAVPEPTSLAAVVLAGAALLGRRRGRRSTP